MPGKQYIVLTGLLMSPSVKQAEAEINKSFAERDWGQVIFFTQFKTLSGQGGEGGRNDVVFSYNPMNEQQMGKFSVQRFGIGQKVSWLEDYLDNNRGIIPGRVLVKLEEKRKW